MTKKVFSTQLGVATVELTPVSGYDIEDIIRDRAYSQAMAAKLLQRGKSIDPNNLKTTRTLYSAYTATSEELPE